MPIANYTMSYRYSITFILIKFNINIMEVVYF